MQITHQSESFKSTTDLHCLLDLFCQRYSSNEGFLILHHCAPTLAADEKRIFICLNPCLKIYLSDSIEHTVTTEHSTEGVPLNTLKRVQSALAHSEHSACVPTLAGFFSYEFLTELESIPLPAIDLFSLPEYIFFLYTQIIEIPLCPATEVTLHNFSYQDLPDCFWDAGTIQEYFQHKASAESTTTALVPANPTFDTVGDFSTLSRQSYCKTVNSIRDHIADGDVYQVNFSHCFTLPFDLPPRSLYQATCSGRIAEQGLFFHVRNNLNQPVSIVSDSPETFFHVRNGRVTTCPIKGTIQRSPDDAQAVAALLSSAKDQAELAMIVDLLRNDLGKVAEPGSVKVKTHARLQSLEHVHHLVSDITATLRTEYTALDTLCALYPCGSITGAPKVAAMHYIARYEAQRRGIYTGSPGFFAPGGDATFSVAIRTATILNQTMYFQAGGGIVYQSEASAEYQETLVKAASLYSAYQRTGKSLFGVN